MSSFPSLVPCFPLSTTSPDRRQDLRPKLITSCRRHLLSTEMLPRAEWQCLVLYYDFFPDVADTRALPPPSLLSSFSIPFPSPIPSSLSLPSPLPPRFFPVTALASVPVPIHFPSLRSFFRFRPRSYSRRPSCPRSRFRLTFVISPPTLLPFPLPLPARVHRCPRPCLRFLSLISVPRAWLPRYNLPAQSRAFVNKAAGGPLTPLPVCRDNDACGIKVPPVQQKREPSPKMCYFRCFRQILGLVRVFLRLVFYRSGCEFYNKSIHI